jgi:2-keto-4-pentenoate hydratase
MYGYMLQRLANTRVTATEVCTVTTYVAPTLEEAVARARQDWPNSPIRDAASYRVFPA